ncbi:MAG: hypothetical protein JEZ05_03360 [Tenericutes bacterium]|nr:hypothetical protein [Mycoplasmatota bacterium]
MKKIFLLILSISLAFGIIACDKDTTTVTQTTVQQTTAIPTTLVAEPVIAGASDKVITQLDELDLLDGLTATDGQDGDLTDSLMVLEGDYTNLEPGEYEVTVYVIDSDDNRTEVSFTVTVSATTFDSAAWAYYDANKIELDVDDLVLPMYSENFTYFYWASNNNQVITGEGFIIKPHVGSDPVDVILTCTAINLGQVVSKSFMLTVQPNEEVTVTSHVTVPFIGTSEEYIVENDSEVNIFYVDEGTVPYIDIEEFLYMVDGAIVPEEITITPDGANGLSLTYQAEWTDFDEVTIITEDYSGYFDFDENTFTVNNFDFFSGYEASTESDYGSGLIYTGADYVDGEEVTIPLGDYNFDLVIYEDAGETYYLAPFAVVNLLFLGSVYYDAYFNGDTIYGTSYLLDDMTTMEDTMRTSSLNSATMAEDLKLSTYNFMALVIDYFYGLKEDKKIESGYDFLSASAKNLITGTDQKVYNKLFDIAYGLDDLHTSHAFPGFYEAPYGMGLSISDLGVRSTAYYEYSWDIDDQLEAKYGASGQPAYELLDNDTICVINIDGFDIDTPDEFAAILDGLPASVTDVVVSLISNGGGNLGAVLRIFGYMTEEAFMYHSQNPADNSAATYYIESESVAYNYDFAVLSSGVSFSAANLFVNIAKELGIPVLGQDSGGGASSIGVIITPDGTGLIISTNNVLSTRVGNETDGYEYLSIEYGVEVDYFMSNVTSDSQLISIINSLRAE